MEYYNIGKDNYLNIIKIIEIMSYPLTSEKDGIKIKSEIMKSETLYHCIFQNKVMLVYKDHNEILNCYEIEDEEIVSKVRLSKNTDIEKILEDYIREKICANNNMPFWCLKNK